MSDRSVYKPSKPRPRVGGRLFGTHRRRYHASRNEEEAVREEDPRDQAQAQERVLIGGGGGVGTAPTIVELLVDGTFELQAPEHMLYTGATIQNAFAYEGSWSLRLPRPFGLGGGTWEQVARPAAFGSTVYFSAMANGDIAFGQPLNLDIDVTGTGYLNVGSFLPTGGWQSITAGPFVVSANAVSIRLWNASSIVGRVWFVDTASLHT